MVESKITPSETPAQSAIHEPDINGDEAFDALHQKLIERLNENHSDYFDTLRQLTNKEIAAWSHEIASTAEAYRYLTEEHGFSTAELEYLLNFKNPLSVVADEFSREGDPEEHSHSMWNLFDKEDALQDNAYERFVDDSAMKPQLFERLDQNLAGIMDVYRTEIAKPGLSGEELRGMAERITAVSAAHEFLKNEFEYKFGDVEYLMHFRVPLQIVAAAWPNSTDRLTNVHDVVREVLLDQGERVLENYLQDAVVDAYANGLCRDAAEKPSVMDQIRRARVDAMNNPAPHKDIPGKERGPEL